MIQFSQNVALPNLSDLGLGVNYAPPTVLIICRDNGLYGEAAIKATLAGQVRGYDIRTHVFPAGTKAKDISPEAVEAIKRNEPVAMFCDNTVQAAVSRLTSPLKGDRFESPRQVTGSIIPPVIGIVDEIFSVATGHQLQKLLKLDAWGLGNQHALSYEERVDSLLSPAYLAHCGRSISLLLSRALLSGLPERIDIYTAWISDHLPFRLFEKLLSADDFHQFSLNPTHELLEKAQANAQYPLKLPHEVVREWVMAAGMDPGRIRIVSDFAELKPRDYKDRRHWVLGDRHLLVREEFESQLNRRFGDESSSERKNALASMDAVFSRATLIRFPIETFVSDLVKSGLLHLPSRYQHNLFAKVADIILRTIDTQVADPNRLPQK